MADTKTTALTELASGSQADTDVLPIVDVSDTTQGASGTLKKFTWSSVKAALKTYFDSLYAPTGPMFRAYLTASQTIPNTTFTKIIYNAESFDTDNCFNTTLGRFIPNKAGYYVINWKGDAHSTSSIGAGSTTTNLYKNGTIISSGTYGGPAPADCKSTGSDIVYMNGTTDYLEVYVYISGTGTLTVVGADGESRFSGYYLRA